MHTFLNISQDDGALTMRELGIEVPEWVNGGENLDIFALDAIRYGGCVSGAFMPAVTYYDALQTMARYGDDVLQYIYDAAGELPAPRHDESWSGMACHYLSAAVELWAQSLDAEIADALEDRREALVEVE